jgi:hypothetical protein
LRSPKMRRKRLTKLFGLLVQPLGRPRTLKATSSWFLACSEWVLSFQSTSLLWLDYSWVHQRWHLPLSGSGSTRAIWPVWTTRTKMNRAPSQTRI